MKKAITSITNIINAEELEEIVPKKSDGSYFDKFKKTLTDEERQAPSYLDWDDQRLGEFIHAIFMTTISSFEMMNEVAYKASAILAHSMLKQNKDTLKLNCCFEPTTKENKYHIFNFSIDKKINKPIDNGTLALVKEQEEKKEQVTYGNSDSQELKLMGVLTQQYSSVGQFARVISKDMQFEDPKGLESCHFATMVLVLMQNSISRNAHNTESTLSGLTLNKKLVSDATYMVKIEHELKPFLAPAKYKM